MYPKGKRSVRFFALVKVHRKGEQDMIKKICALSAVFFFICLVGGFLNIDDAVMARAERVQDAESGQNDGQGNADNGEINEDEEGREEEVLDEQSVLEELTEDLTAFKVPFVKISSDLNNYLNDKKQLSLKSEISVPYEIKMKKPGVLSFMLQTVSPLNEREKITLKIYKDKDFSYPVLYKKIENGESIIEFESFLEKGTYDFIFDLSGREKTYANMTFVAYNTSDFKADMQGKNYIGYGNNKKIYIKLKIKKAGIIKFSTAMQMKNAEGSGFFTGIRYELCDANKNPLCSGMTELEQAYMLSYGIRGGTYYVGITPTYGLYKFSYEIEEHPGSNNTKKENAYKLKRNQLRYHIFPVGCKKNVQYWFTFTLKKPAKLNLKMEFQGEDALIHASLYQNDKMVKIGDSMLIEFPANELQSFNWKNEDGSYDLWPAGTYYIRVGKNADNSNGVIKLLIG